jgi:Zn-dependent protease with chaperone function
LGGLIAAACALWLQAQGLVASPHLGGARPHLCLVPLLQAPAGAYRLRLFAWIALVLVALALVRLIAGAFTSHLLRRLAVASGASPSRPVGREGNVLVVSLGTPTSFCAGLLRPVVVLSSDLLDGLDPGQMGAVAAHELGHARRHDNLAALIADVCTILLAFMPTAHYYRQQWRAASEAAADDAALAGGVPPSALREALEGVQRAQQRRRPGPLSLLSLLIPPPDVSAQRLQRLAAREHATPRSASEGGLRRALPWIVFAVGLAAVALFLLVSHQSVQDSLFCAAEQIARPR